MHILRHTFCSHLAMRGAPARAIQVGDPAPDFTLPVLHGERVVTLSNEYRHKPVVLVFGSYS